MKSRMRKFLAATLCVAMCISLAACGSKGNGNGSGNGGTNSATENAKSEAAKQNVYSYENIDLGLGTDYNISGMSYEDGKISVLTTQYDYSTEYGSTIVSLLTMDLDGSNQNKAVLYNNSNGTNGYFGSSTYANGKVYALIETYANSESEIGADDSVAREESATVESATTEVTTTKEDAAANTTEGETTEGESSYKMELVCWDMTGTEVYRTDMLKASGAEYFYVSSGLIAGDNDSIYMISDNIIYQADTSGNVTKGATIDSANIGNTFTDKSGNLIMMVWNDEWTKQSMCTVDLATGTMGELQEIPAALNNYNSIQGGTTYDLLITNSEGIFGYNIGDTESTKILDYVNSDLPTSWLNSLYQVDDKTIFASYYDNVQGGQVLGVFHYVDPSTITDKKVFTVASYWMDSNLLSRVVNFNKTNSEYRITVKDYSTYNTGDDYMAGVTQLNNDILAGNMPDILVLNNNMPIDSYVSKGLFADINKFLEEDEEINRDDYFTNVFDAYTVDDKLYCLVPSFTVSTYVAKTSIVGDIDTWTIEDMLALNESKPEGSSLFGLTYARNNFFYTLMQYNGSMFIDSETGKCSFDSPEFISMLEFMSTLPEEYDYNSEEVNDYWNSYESQYRENRTLLYPLNIYNLASIDYDLHGSIGEPVSFMGFPSSEGNGSVISPSAQYAISSKSAYQDAAWEFLRYYLTDEYQSSDQMYQLPVLKSALDKQAEKSKEKPYTLDEDGNKVEYDKTFYLNGTEIILDPLTDEELSNIITFIGSVNKPYYYNEEIQNIVLEEAAAYFSGQKTAQDVATIIQSRVQIYVDENR